MALLAVNILSFLASFFRSAEVVAFSVTEWFSTYSTFSMHLGHLLTYPLVSLPPFSIMLIVTWVFFWLSGSSLERSWGSHATRFSSLRMTTMFRRFRCCSAGYFCIAPGHSAAECIFLAADRLDRCVLPAEHRTDDHGLFLSGSGQVCGHRRHALDLFHLRQDAGAGVGTVCLRRHFGGVSICRVWPFLGRYRFLQRPAP